MFFSKVLLMCALLGLSLLNAQAATGPARSSPDAGIAQGVQAIAAELDKLATLSVWTAQTDARSPVSPYEAGRLKMMRRWLGALEAAIGDVANNGKLGLSQPTRGALEQLKIRLRIPAYNERFQHPVEFSRLLSLVATEMRKRFPLPDEKAPLLERMFRRKPNMGPHDVALTAMLRSTLAAVRNMRDLDPKSDLEKSSPEQYWKGANSFMPEIAKLVRGVEAGVRPYVANRRWMLQTYHEIERAEMALTHIPVQAKSIANVADAEMVTLHERIRLSDPHSSCEVPLVAEQYPPREMPAPLPALPALNEITLAPADEAGELNIENSTTNHSDVEPQAPLGENEIEFKVEE